MAAIAGILGKNARSENVEAMLETIRHRGPDSINLHKDGPCCAGVRAAKLSPPRGNGFARKGTVALLFDGEIYNPRPDGTSDAEVALDLYAKHGRTFAAHLQGVFACAVCDGDRVLLARDAVGVRPLYWGRTRQGDLCFVSEAKALVALADDVTELLPAATFSSATGVAAYLPQHPAVTVPSALEPAVRQVRDTLMRAVARRLEDGAVGACLLSGGLDSSIIACAAYELGAKVPLLTVGLEGAPDLANAAAVARHLGAEHRVRLYDADRIADLVPQAVWALESFDEDCVSGAISNLVASAFASETTNCILSGEGGDELFGGYHLLKNVPTESGRLTMMQRLIAVAYNTALQRLDRAMFASGINYRTPFIDSEVVALALQLPVRWKVHPEDDGRLVEKFILREAFKDLLPDPIYRREKLRFSAGTGTDGLMDEVALRHGIPADLDASERDTAQGYRLNSPKELWYYRIFTQRFPGPAFECLVGRWDPAK
jgi:asparagine synthase (glutamine-hydrolysing)